MEQDFNSYRRHTLSQSWRIQRDTAKTAYRSGFLNGFGLATAIFLTIFSILFVF